MENTQRKHALGDDSAISVRPVQPADEEFLLAVYASTRADELSVVSWDEAQKLAFLRHQFNAQRQEYVARFPEADYRVILWHGGAAGRLWVARMTEQIRLLDIALLPQYQKMGIGTFLLRQLIAESEQTGLPLRHMVFQLNPAAQRFYERLGFTPIGEVNMYVHMERRPGAHLNPPAA